MADEEHAPDPAAVEKRLNQALFDFESRAKKLLEELGQKKVELIDGEEGKPSLLEELTTAKEEVEDAVEAIQAFYEQLHTPAEGEEKALVTAIPEAVQAITEAKARIDASEADIKAYQESLFGKLDGNKLTVGIKQQIELEAQELSELHSKIFQSTDPNKKPLSDQVGIFLDEFAKKKNELEAIRAEIIDYQDALLGELQDDGKRTDGIKGQVDKYVADLKNLLDENTDQQSILLDDIEGLLKGASTVALAKSFKEHKDAFNTGNIIWLIVFIVSIGAMMGLSVWGFVRADYEFTDMWKYTLGNLPFLAGSVWLAIYASKQRSQNKRLQEEYGFKEDVAKVYYGLKKEIEELGDSELGQKLNERILDVIVEVVAKNPSSTLESKSHDDKGPVFEALHKIGEALGKMRE